MDNELAVGTGAAVTPKDTALEMVIRFTSDAELAKRYLVYDEPVAGNIRFGVLLEDLDKFAEQCALGYVHLFFPEARVVTAAIDDIVVRRPADTTRDLKFSACINHVGSSSMEVGIRVEHVGTGGYHVLSAYFTMVARSGTDDNASSLKLPQLCCQTEIEKKRFDKALKRRLAYRESLVRSQEPPSADEYRMLKSLHVEQENGGSGKRAAELTVQSWQRIYPLVEYNPRTAFGGWLMNQAHMLASLAAEQLAPDRVVIARVQRANFIMPVRLSSKIHICAKVIYASRHSVTVKVDIVQISRDRVRQGVSNSCMFTFWNVDADLSLLPVPPVYPVTYTEDEEYLYAYRQRIEPQ